MSEENKDLIAEEEMETGIILTDDDGNEVEFDLLDSVEYEGKTYLVMLPADDNDDGNGIIMLLEEGETEDDDTLLTVTDEKVLDEVYAIFREANKDFFDFED